MFSAVHHINQPRVLELDKLLLEKIVTSDDQTFFESSKEVICIRMSMYYVNKYAISCDYNITKQSDLSLFTKDKYRVMMSFDMKRDYVEMKKRLEAKKSFQVIHTVREKAVAGYWQN